jgi:hypothetical protein
MYRTLRICPNGAFPKADHMPLLLPQQPGRTAIAEHVRSNLLAPVYRIRALFEFLRQFMPPMTMPEIPVTENNEPRPCEHDVGLTGKRRHVLSKAQSAVPKEASQKFLVCGVGATVHPLRQRGSPRRRFQATERGHPHHSFPPWHTTRQYTPNRLSRRHAAHSFVRNYPFKSSPVLL